MPEELKSADDFIKAASMAQYCSIKTNNENVKLKLRTPRTLYTYKTTAEEADKLLKKINVEKREVR